jgi:hypothetical protein
LDAEGVRASIAVSGTLRVRAEPSTSAAILGRLRDGAAVLLLARDELSQWWQIAYPNAVSRAWIAAEFTKPEGTTDALPIANGNAPTPTATPAETQAPAANAVMNVQYVPSSAPFDLITTP